MKTYTVKLEDKAVLLNRLEKAGYPVSSLNIKDNELEGTFNITVDSPEQEQALKVILKQSPSINDIKETKMDNKNNKKSLKKDELKEMIRQELQGVLAEKKKVKDADKKEQLDETEQIDESLTGVESLLAALFGLGVPVGLLVAQFVKVALKKGGSAAAEEFKKAIDQSKGV